MNYILPMTSAGSLLFIGELLLEKAMGKHMSQVCRYKMLVMVLFAFLMPWVWLKSVYKTIGISVPIPFGINEATVVSGRMILGDAAFHAVDELVVTLDYNNKLSFLSVWMGIAVIAMIVRCAVYFYNRHKLLKCAQSCGTDVPEELVQRLKQEFNIKRRVRIVRLVVEKHCFTLGVINPVVFLQKNSRADEIENILRHEFTHIARGDLLIKMLMELVCCVHWFNPFVYWLNCRLDRACEKACDAKVVRNMSDAEKGAYALLVVKSMRKSKKVFKRKTLFGNFFASNDKHAEERIRAIMDTRKRKLWEKIVVAGAFAVLLFVDSLTALAYPQVFDVQDMSMEMAAIVEQGTSLLKREAVETDAADLGAEIIENVPILYDEQIITADGEIYPVQGQTRAFCLFHKWEDAQYEIHVRNDNGGCTVTVYACTYCPRCDTIKMGEKLYTTEYVTCNHNYD